MAVDLLERTTPRARKIAALVTVLTVLSLNGPPAQAAPAPREEEWWFDAWQVSGRVWPLTEGEGVTLGLIDTGVNARLPELNGAVLPGSGGDSSPNGDGRTDTDTKSGGHGTGMAALIAGRGSGSGMAGIAPKSRILPVVSSTFGFAKDIRYAVDHGAKVINMSEVIPAARCPDGIRSAVGYAIDHDVVLVAGAGNDPLYDSEYTPANCPGVLTVGAVSAKLVPWAKSTPGSNVALAAPGVSVGSIGRTGAFISGLNGTSQAAALTSGVVALMRSRFPHMSGREIVQRMLATARDVGPKGWDKKTGYGALIPYKALTADVPETAPNPVYTSFEKRGAEQKTERRPVRTARQTATEERDDHSRVYIILGTMFALTAAVAVAVTVLYRRRGGRKSF
ncbi:S8 family serine peptidase [Actinomadura opuntiae]|uniref:S8 family serine peptidase n=1 Tax=Actinomadura sp. OS1-43 TaxID=604315 RepID=UPI00255B063D|nr:S8 family serine peptidase [Actinomadura sp. OS1-43]MDL4817682.1 S8 family serine peptidase [Actinomadura sp. OS1-43]